MHRSMKPDAIKHCNLRIMLIFSYPVRDLYSFLRHQSCGTCKAMMCWFTRLETVGSVVGP